MNRMAVLFTMAIASLVSVAFAQAGALDIAPIQPNNPGFGQAAQFSVTATQNGKPVKNAKIEFWFSGRHGVRVPSWFVTTNAEGRATFTRTIPRDWVGQQTWVDLNASCDQIAVLKLWRVRGK
ncbi:MAG: hypothetical protein NTX57_05000 [Armatimonadetes bacterium]|nr:hypothetical protein [Armatimonadota bacterium]